MVSPQQKQEERSSPHHKKEESPPKQISSNILAHQVVTNNMMLSNDAVLQVEEHPRSTVGILPSISNNQPRSPSHVKQLPLLAKRNPEFKLAPLQISPQFESYQITSSPKKKSPKKQRTVKDSPNREQEDCDVYPVFEMPSPIPILSKNNKVQIEPEVLWKQRRIGNQTNDKICIQENHDALEQGDSPVQKKERDNQLLEAQSQLLSNADLITVNQIMPIQTALYPKLFQYKVYECYKPQNLKSARNYLRYLTNENQLRTPELNRYLTYRLDTQFPLYVDQKKLLQFDSNFECGNLDSAYLFGDSKYTLLLKVDTNTRGGSHWFYFKVLNWRPGQTVEFQILNLVRNLRGFYDKGMNIYTRTENLKGTHQTEWSLSKEVTEVFGSNEPNPVVRTFSKDNPPTPINYYNSLSFRCKFPEATRDPMGGGMSVFCFAYALPYGFNDLIRDLRFVQGSLINDGGIVAQLKDFQQSNFRYSQSEGLPGSVPQSPTKIKQYLFENNTNQNFTKQEQKIIEGQTEDDLTEQTKLVDQIRNKSRIEINTSLLIYRQEVISISVGGLNVHKLTITLQQLKGYPPIRKRKVILLQARLHAAETYGSLAMRNLINELVSQPEKYKYVLGHYIFKLVPMINVDGVVIGNSRNSLVGVDLNRRWKEPNSIMHPEIYFLKLSLLEQSQAEIGISIFCDMHGHNKKPNCFFFGCSKASEEAMVSWTKTRLLPKIFASNEPIFDYNSCRFSEDRDKQSTARVVVWREMKVTNSFTLEISMFGKSIQQPSQDSTIPSQLKVESIYTQFVNADFLQIATNFIKSIGQFTLVEKQLEKIDWLKPSILKEITGQSARNRVKWESSQKLGMVTSDFISKTSKKLVLSKKSSIVVGSNGGDLKIDSADASKQDLLINQDSQQKKVVHAVRKYQSTIQINQVVKDIPKKEPQSAIASKKQSPKLSSTNSYYSEPEDKNKSEELSIDWKKFFDPLEIQNKIANFADSSNQGRGSVTSDSDEAASDSQPSCDNIDETDFCDFFKGVLKVESKPIKKAKLASVSQQPIIKLQVMELNKTLRKQKLVTLVPEIDRSRQVSIEEHKLALLQEMVSERIEKMSKKRIHPTILRIDSNVEKQLGIPSTIAPKDKDGNVQINILHANQGYSFRQQERMNQQLSYVRNHRNPNLKNLHVTIDKIASPITLTPAELNQIEIRNQKQMDSRQQYVLDQNSQVDTQKEQPQQNLTSKNKVKKIVSNTTVTSSPQQVLSPVSMQSKLKDYNSVASPIIIQYTNNSDDFSNEKNPPKLALRKKLSETYAQPLQNIALNTDNSPASLQILSPRTYDKIPLQKIIHQNIQQISNSIVINNYYSPQSSSFKIQRQTQRQPEKLSKVPKFEPPFEVTSLSKKTSVKEAVHYPVDNSRNLASDHLKPRINQINLTSGQLIPPSNVPSAQNNIRVSFVIKRKK